jgi:hypothetical protein
LGADEHAAQEEGVLDALCAELLARAPSPAAEVSGVTFAPAPALVAPKVVKAAPRAKKKIASSFFDSDSD